MTIYIDSALVNEVAAARSLGWVGGVTTNPILLANTSREPQTVLMELAHLKIGPVFYQLVSRTLEGMHREMGMAAEILGSALVLKVPPTENGFRFVAQCTDFPCCVTAIYSPAQALVAREAKAAFAAVYVNRATRLLGDGIQQVREIAGVLKNSSTEIIAASVKSAEEACSSISAGAHHLTLPYEVLSTLMAHPLTEQTIAEFSAKGVGIASASQETLTG
jgi:transaldolase